MKPCRWHNKPISTHFLCYMHLCCILTIQEARGKMSLRKSSRRENTFTVLIEKNWCVSGPVYFKPTLFKSHLKGWNHIFLQDSSSFSPQACKAYFFFFGWLIFSLQAVYKLWAFSSLKLVIEPGSRNGRKSCIEPGSSIGNPRILTASLNRTGAERQDDSLEEAYRSEVERTGRNHRCNLLLMWPWASYLSSLNLSVLFSSATFLSYTHCRALKKIIDDPIKPFLITHVRQIVAIMAV